MIRVLVVDDEALVRSGLRMILEAAGDIAVVGEAADGAEAVATATRLRADVVLLDVRMPGTDGLTAAARLALLPDPPKVVMLTTFDRDEYVHRALRAGAVGFLLKDTPPRDLAAAVRTVARGLSNAEIGRALGMREATVKAHVSRSLAKLGLDNRVQAAILVHESGLR